MPAAAHGWRSRTSRWASRSRGGPALAQASGPSRVRPLLELVADRLARSCASRRLIAPKPSWPTRRGAQPSVTNGLDAISVPSASVGDLEVGEHVRHLALQLAQALDGQRADLDVGVLGGAHGDEVPPGPVVAGDDDPGLGGVGQHRPGRLAGLLAAQRGVRDVGEALLQPFQQLVVGLHRRRGGLDEQRVQLRVVGDDVRLDHRRVALGHVALGELASRRSAGAGSARG